MKYLRYILIILFKLFCKVFGLFWYWIALPFRAYARNRVYNYVLQNDLHLPRLSERKPQLSKWHDDILRYFLSDIHKVQERNDITIRGYIKYRKVSWIEFQFCFWFIWGWVDDDSNHDTMSGGYIKGKIYGNTFDLGDVRGLYPEFELKESWAWVVRNTAYNFNYYFEEIAEKSKYNFYHRFTTKWFDWHFGFIPYSNSERQGRMVWFSEDIDRIDDVQNKS